MKLETIRQALQEIASGAIPGHKAGMWIEDHAHDIDTLLAEVERLKAEREPPLPAEVEEMRDIPRVANGNYGMRWRKASDDRIAMTTVSYGFRCPHCRAMERERNRNRKER